MKSTLNLIILVLFLIANSLQVKASSKCEAEAVLLPKTTTQTTSKSTTQATTKSTTTSTKSISTTTPKPTITAIKTTTTSIKPTTTAIKTTTTTIKTTTTSIKPSTTTTVNPTSKTSTSTTTTTSTKISTSTSTRTSTSTSTSSTNVATPTQTGLVSGFVKTLGTSFTLNGCKFYFEGVNNYYMTYSGNSSATTLLDGAKALNIKVLRAWAFIDAVPKNNIVYQTFNPQTFHNDQLVTLDYLVYQASLRGIRLILVFTNNWADFGGVDEYVKAYGATYHDDFYSNSAIKAAFKNWVNNLVNRKNVYSALLYKNDPAIFAWELINEPRCKGSGSYPTSSKCNIALTTSWVSEMCSYVKSLDTNHLVGVGDEGFLNNGGSTWPYQGGEGIDSAKFMAQSCIDFGTAHLYPDSWGFTNAASWGNQWITDHANLATTYKKPVVIEEYGLQSQSNRLSVYGQWHTTMVNSQIGGSLVWMLASDTSIPDYDGYTLYVTGGTSTNSAKAVLGSIINSMTSKSAC